MKIEIRKVDQERGIVQITTSDERWYVVQKAGQADIFMPSVTWICSYYPKGAWFTKWVAEKGYDEAEAIKREAGDKGSKVHKAISDILMGQTIKIDSKYSANGEEPVELTAIEYEAVMSFVNWLNMTQPEVLAIDYTLVNPEAGYAGTIDMKLRINGEIWIVDIKTSKDVYPSHELQVSAYKKADPEVQKIAILQVGYTKNKAKFKFTEIEDKYPLFEAAKAIWANETAGVHPMQKDFPLELSWKKEIEKPVEGTIEKIDKAYAKLVKPKKKIVVRKKAAKK